MEFELILCEDCEHNAITDELIEDGVMGIFPIPVCVKEIEKGKPIIECMQSLKNKNCDCSDFEPVLCFFPEH